MLPPFSYVFCDLFIICTHKSEGLKKTLFLVCWVRLVEPCCLKKPSWSSLKTLSKLTWLNLNFDFLPGLSFVEQKKYSQTPPPVVWWDQRERRDKQRNWLRHKKNEKVRGSLSWKRQKKRERGEPEGMQLWGRGRRDREVVCRTKYKKNKKINLSVPSKVMLMDFSCIFFFFICPQTHCCPPWDQI